MYCELDDSFISILNFLILLWLCKRIFLFLGNSHEVLKSKGIHAMSATYKIINDDNDNDR